MNVCKILRNIFLALCGICFSIGIALIDNANWIFTIIMLIMALVCIFISIVFDNLLFEIAYKYNNNEGK